uniref:Uncharacterized protein n=1 Tax=Trichogramma kaykai TaxID=54128 RepID=A0ABD2X2H9_9HYME
MLLTDRDSVLFTPMLKIERTGMSELKDLLKLLNPSVNKLKSSGRNTSHVVSDYCSRGHLAAEAGSGRDERANNDTSSKILI